MTAWAAATDSGRGVAQLRAALGPAAQGAVGATLDHLDWVARLPSAAAPGFVYLAGACRGWPAGGGGRDLAEAAARLAGEAAEVLVQTAAHPPCGDPPDPAIDAVWSGGAATARVVAANLTRDRRTGVPAAAIALDGPAATQRRKGAPPASLGLAAGPDLDAARLAGALELIERDAAAAWWLAGQRPRQAEAGALAPAAAEVARMRAGAALPRATGFLELHSVAGVPVVCALSRDTDGRGLAFGLKAAPDPRAAAMGAVMELLQMEIALEMARLRAAQGRTAEGDRGPLARAGLDPDGLAAFAASAPAVQPAAAPADFDRLAAHLAALGLEVTVADFPAGADGLAVAKVFVPGLRPLPGGPEAVPGTPGALAALMG